MIFALFRFSPRCCSLIHEGPTNNDLHGCFDDHYLCLNAFRTPTGFILDPFLFSILVSFSNFASPDYVYHAGRLDSPFTNLFTSRSRFIDNTLLSGYQLIF